MGSEMCIRDRPTPVSRYRPARNRPRSWSAKSISRLKRFLHHHLLSGNRKPRDLRPRPNQRNGISKNEIARLKKKLEKVEADIHVLEKRRAEIEKEIHSGLKDHQTLRRLSVEFQAIEEELETRFQSWEDLTEQLDAS